MYKLYNDDCLEVLEKIIKENKIDLILTDLPYGITQNKLDIPINLEKMWKIIKDIPFITTAHQPFTTDLINSNRENFKYIIYWDKILKSGFLNAKKQPLRVVEDIVIFYKKQITYNPQMKKGKPLHHSKKDSKAEKFTNKNYGKLNKNFQTKRKFATLKYPTNLIRFQKPKSAKNKPLFHPTEKPIELYKYLIKTYSNKNDTILDITMGSGTTGIACFRANRNFIGIEKDKKFFNIAKERIKNETTKNI